MVSCLFFPRFHQPLRTFVGSLSSSSRYERLMSVKRSLRSRGKPLIKASEGVSAESTSLKGDAAEDPKNKTLAGGTDKLDNSETSNNVNERDENCVEGGAPSKRKRSSSTDPSRQSKKKCKEKELQKQIKDLRKDCKKLQKSIGKWMLETTPLPPSDIKSNVKQFLEANSEKSSRVPDRTEVKKENDLPIGTETYRWNSPHIKSFFASSKRSLIQTNRLDIKLVCPIGKQRIKHPVRGSSCHHIQPFDRDTFLKLERVSIGKLTLVLEAMDF